MTPTYLPVEGGKPTAPLIPYEAFLRAKASIGSYDGFEPVFMPEKAKDFQQILITWALRSGRGAILADTGLGKSLMELAWAENVVRKTSENVLLLTPLAVSKQTISEGEKFGIEVKRAVKGKVHRGITVANYDQLHNLDPDDFGGIVGDESSILKNFDGSRRKEITEFSKRMRYRLMCTATAAPNDYTELGTTSEALGYLGYIDMLNRFFRNIQNTTDTTAKWRVGGARHEWEGKQWRFKGHAEVPFWRWVCSWARAIRKPSDLGCEDTGYILPPLSEVEHIIETQNVLDGFLFAVDAVTLEEQREERRRTVKERCELVASLVDTGKSALIWCHLNEEGRALRSMIPDAVEVTGSESTEAKEEKLLAFAEGSIRALVTKPKIGAWGLNYQNCAHIVSFPSHSYEQYYQSVRRCWRFGQQLPVRSDIVTTRGERGVLKNVQRKAAAADRMFSRLVAEMNNELSIERTENFTTTQEVPVWL